MEEETKKIINEKIREFLKEDDTRHFDRAVQLIKAIKNPLNCE